MGQVLSWALGQRDAWDMIHTHPSLTEEMRLAHMKQTNPGPMLHCLHPKGPCLVKTWSLWQWDTDIQRVIFLWPHDQILDKCFLIELLSASLALFCNSIKMLTRPYVLTRYHPSAFTLGLRSIHQPKWIWNSPGNSALGSGLHSLYREAAQVVKNEILDVNINNIFHTSHKSYMFSSPLFS